jgi:putative proteasome-type protease
MTYCVGIMVDGGLIFASDSRTHAGVDNFASFCKLNLFERAGDRVIVLLSSGGLAGTQAIISLLRQRATKSLVPSLWDVESMYDAALLVSDVMREVGQRDGEHLEGQVAGFNPSFILGGQIKGEPQRLFRLYSEGNFIEVGDRTPYLQTGETKYGKPIIDWVITRSTPLNDAAKCVLVSFESTMRSNLSVGMPIDLICYERDSLQVSMQRRFASGDAYFESLGAQWSEGTRNLFATLPELQWRE